MVSGPTKTLAKLANHIAKIADRSRPYPGHLAQVCNLVTPVRGGSIEGFRGHRSRQTSGRRTEDRSTARRRRRADGARPGALATSRPAQAVQRRPEKTVLELRGTSCLSMGRGAGGEAADPGPAPSARQSPSVAGIAEAVSEFAPRAQRACVSRDGAAGAVNVSSRPARSAGTMAYSPSVMRWLRPTSTLGTWSARAAAAVHRPVPSRLQLRQASSRWWDLQPAGQRQANRPVFAVPGRQGNSRSDSPRRWMATMDETEPIRSSVYIGSA